MTNTMIAQEHSNSRNITARTLADQPTRVGVTIAPDGHWHVTVNRQGTQHVDRHAHAFALDALLAAARIARQEPGELDLGLAHRQMLISHWHQRGEALYDTGRPLDACVNGYERQGWWDAAQAEAVREEADAKPGLDAEVDPAPTLEEALALQIRALNERIARNKGLLNGEVA